MLCHYLQNNSNRFGNTIRLSGRVLTVKILNMLWSRPLHYILPSKVDNDMYVINLMKFKYYTMFIQLLYIG